MSRALRLARRGYGSTSPNPMVGAVLVKAGRVIGEGWHRQAGMPHAEIEALARAQRLGCSPKGATLYVTLEPCSTHGRTPPCTEAIIASGIRSVVVGAVDPNPLHAGRGLKLLQRAGIRVTQGVLELECERLNATFNFWIQHRRPFVTVKAAMTLDGKIAAPSGESKWITGPRARKFAMHLRLGADAILVGINTVLADNPELTIRLAGRRNSIRKHPDLRRIVLDASARIPLNSRLVTDAFAGNTTVVVSRQAPKDRVRVLEKHVRIIVAPALDGCINLSWLLNKLGTEQVTHLLVEGGGEVHASFLLSGLAHRVAFFYAPKVLGGAKALKAVAGTGVRNLAEALELAEVEWRKLGPDWLLTAAIKPKANSKHVHRNR